MHFFDVITYTLFHTMIRSSTPVILAAIAAVISKQAKVINIGIEGTMLFGAYFGYVVGNASQSWVLGVLTGMIVGILLGVIVGMAHLKFKAHILVVGFAINMLALAMTRFLLQQTYNVSGALILPNPVSIPSINLAFLQNYPVLESLFSGYCIIELIAIVLVILTWFVLYRTSMGLHLRSVGLHELAAETAGIKIVRMRFIAITISGLFSGLAGAYLSMGYSTMFVENMTNGRGFMALAAMNFGSGNPIWAMFGALIFGFTDAVALRLQSYGFPAQLLMMLPYIVTVMVLAIAMLRARRKEKKTMLKQSSLG